VKSVNDRIIAIQKQQHKKGAIPPLWDGQSTRRILETCMLLFAGELKQKNIYSI
jgi:hypothetical protein